MQTFARLLSIFTSLLSLGFIAHARPAGYNGALVSRTGSINPPSNSNGGRLPDIMITMSNFQNEMRVKSLELGGAPDVEAAANVAKIMNTKIETIANTYCGKKLNNVTPDITKRVAVIATNVVGNCALAAGKFGDAATSQLDGSFLHLYSTFDSTLGPSYRTSCVEAVKANPSISTNVAKFSAVAGFLGLSSN
ncbi:hypothetical protein FRC12_019744 [Ceratobasidium sp. 428]|nr:hypothetical protein FRC12_019744 [Ceratobasidium sp. 428]